MARFSEFLRRLAVLFRRRHFDRDLEEEMQFHLEMQAEENQASGISAEESRYAARRQFGNTALLKETSREIWGLAFIQQLAQDAAYALRLLWKNPGFSVIAIAVLALGSGANTAIFSVVNSVLLRPLPFPDPHQLVYLTEVNKQSGIEGGWIAPGNYLQWRERSHSMQDMGAFVSTLPTLTGAGEPVRLNGVQATASLLTTLGIKLVLGRPFSREEDQPGRNAVALLSENLWRERFGARSDILGRSVVLDRKPHTIVGIVSSAIRLEEEPWDVWTPLGLGPGDRDEHNSFYLYAIGRMKSGIGVEQARLEMRSVGASIYREHAGLTGWEVVTERLSDQLVRGTRPQLLLLSASVALLLLVACVNVANMLLARSARRTREIAVRSALGAGRWRIIRQLLTENLVLWLLAGAAGLFIAYWAVGLLYGLMPEGMLTGVRPKVDLSVLGFTLVVSLATGVLFGLAPAFRGARFGLVESLKEAGRSIIPGRGRFWGALVISEAALAVVLLIGAGLLLRSFARILAVDPGFRPERLLTFQVPVSDDYSDSARVAFYEEVLHRVKAIPGVRAAAGAQYLPITGYGPNNEFAVEGRPEREVGPFVGTRIITPGYFDTMGISLLRGRDLDLHDEAARPEVAVINESMAAGSWPGEDPVGRRFRLNPRDQSPWITVVGVVHDVKHFGLEGKRWPEAFLPERQRAWPDMRLVVRTAADPLAMLPAVRSVIRGIDSRVPVAEVRTMEKIVADSVAPRRLSMIFVTAFAGLALALASIGLYGVVSYSAVQRRHELGVRMALGADRQDLLRLVFARGMMLTLVGLTAGIAASLAITRLLSGMLFGVTPLDPLTYAAVSLVVMTAAGAAAYVPARRATKVDPMEALRYE